MTDGHERVIFGQPWFDEAEERLLVQTLRSGWIGQGPLVERFEQALASYAGCDEAVAVSSCTAALHLALVALGIGPGDEVITTPFTFVATVNAIEHAGATPVLVDIDRTSLNLVPEDVARQLSDRTRAILPVHFGGRPLDTEGFYRLADDHGLWIIEDAAHALGAVAHGRRVGGSRHPRSLTCFSFYPNKNVASADGGAICLADQEVARRLRRLRLHGLDGDAWNRYTTATYSPSLAVEAGFKYNWNDLQAAIALCQLDKLEGFLAIREHLAARYDDLLSKLPGIELLDHGPDNLRWRHAFHLYQFAVTEPGPRRDQVVSDLRESGVGAAVHYIGINHHPYYAARFPAPLPASDWASTALISLPLHPHIHERVQVRVVDALARAVRPRRPARVPMKVAEGSP